MLFMRRSKSVLLLMCKLSCLGWFVGGIALFYNCQTTDAVPTSAYPSRLYSSKKTEPPQRTQSQPVRTPGKPND